jgi:NADPH:quinone reductase-like Zn-dependent oxidoreductase
MVRSIGADHVLDYTKEDFVRNGLRYDLIIVANGHRFVLDYWRALGPDGTCVVLGGSLAQVLQGLLLGPVLSRLASKKMSNMLARTNQADLVVMAELLESGQVVPVIDRCFPLSQVAEAMRYLVVEHARGKVIISVDQ